MHTTETHTLESVIDSLAKELALSPSQESEIFDFVHRDSISPHVCHFVLMQILNMKARGKAIDNPVGFFIALTRKHRNLDPNTHAKDTGKASHREKKNPLAGEGYDFWFDGDRELRDNTCERIVHGFDSDDHDEHSPYSKAEAARLLKECAPCLAKDEMKPVMLLATDYQHKYPTIQGSYAARLAEATRRVVAYRARCENAI